MNKFTRMIITSLSIATVLLCGLVNIESVSASNKIPKGKDSIIYGEPLGPDLSKIGKPKKLNFKIDYENYDLKFTDIPEDHEYRKAIIWAVENGILKNESKALNPNEVIKKRELMLTLQDLRYKYHYKKRTQHTMDWYRGLVKRKYIPEDIIKRSYPEAVALYGIGFMDVPIYEAKGLIKVKIYTDVFYNTQLSKYNPNAIVKRNFLYYLAGIPYDEGFASASDPFIHTVNSDEYRENLVETYSKKILISFLNNKKIKIPKDYGKDYGNYWLLVQTKFGIGFMQRIGLLKLDPTFDDLKLDHKVKRGEFFDFLYRMCKHIQEDALKKDFRAKPPRLY